MVYAVEFYFSAEESCMKSDVARGHFLWLRISQGPECVGGRGCASGPAKWTDRAPPQLAALVGETEGKTGAERRIDVCLKIWRNVRPWAARWWHSTRLLAPFFALLCWFSFFSCDQIVVNCLHCSDALDTLGLKRYCCRRMLLAHVDLIEKLLNYAPLEKWTVLPNDCFTVHRVFALVILCLYNVVDWLMWSLITNGARNLAMTASLFERWFIHRPSSCWIYTSY